jgi:hypothetical protein
MSQKHSTKKENTARQRGEVVPIDNTVYQWEKMMGKCRRDQDTLTGNTFVAG